MASKQIIVGNRSKLLTITAHHEALCPGLACLKNYTTLPNTNALCMKAVLNYLDGDRTFRAIKFKDKDNFGGHRAAVTWLLGGQLMLPELQNALIDYLRGEYLDKSLAKRGGPSVYEHLASLNQTPCVKKIVDFYTYYFAKWVDSEDVLEKVRRQATHLPSLFRNEVAKYVEGVFRGIQEDLIKNRIEDFYVEAADPRTGERMYPPIIRRN